MSENGQHKINIINRSQLPDHFPTHVHPSEFWEWLGRTVATYGFLEEILTKAFFAFTATRLYPIEDMEKTHSDWLRKLEKSLTDPLVNLADSYGKAVKEYHGKNIYDIDRLIIEIKEAAKIRNVLCHGSWWPPDSSGKSLPFFIDKNHNKFSTPIDIEFLRQTQIHVANLACSVIDSVTSMGWQFPSSESPGKPVW